MAVTSPEEQRRRARRSWAALRARAATVTPEAIGRFTLAATTIAVCLAVVAGTWPTLLPFVAGGVLAYAVLPLANALDRFLPRVLAALIAELVALAVIVFAFVVVIPPLLTGLARIATNLPTGDQVQAQLAALQAQVGDLPEPVRTIVLTVFTDVAANLRAAVEGFAQGAANFISSQILGIFETASFLLGLLVIPVWVLTIVRERDIKRRVAAAFSPGLQPDAFAVLRIVDRGLATFIRVQVVQAILVGTLIWLGITLSNSAGLTDVQYAVSAATLLGVMQIVPQLGFLLGFLPLLLVLPLSGPTAFVTLVVIYSVANRLAGTAVSSGVSRGVLEVHPALMIPGIVVIGQLGVIPLLAAAPIIAISRDLVRYVHARLGDPPLPAGTLPGTRRAPAPGTSAATPVPSIYRDALQPAAMPTLATPAAARPLPSGIVAAQSSPATEWRPTT